MPYRYDPSALKAVFDGHFTFLAGFRRNVVRYRDRPALIDPGGRAEGAEGRQWTYGQLGDDVEHLAGNLAERGVGAGDVVAFQLTNRPEFALLYLAAQRAGAIAAPVNFRFAPGETAHVLDDSEPRVFVYEATAAAGDAEAALRMASHRPDLLVAVRPPSGAAAEDEAFDEKSPGSTAFADLLRPGAVAPEPSGRTAWDESTRLYTSGTTGRPKGVSLPSVSEVLTAHDVIMHFPLDPEDRTLNMTPWFHRGGISPGGPNAVFYAGACAVVMGSFDADACLDMVPTHGLTYLIGAPTNLALLAAAQERTPRDLSSLRGIVTMGAPLERAACLRYQEVLTPRIFNGYGTTEAFWNTFLRPSDLPDRAGTAGRACTDDDVVVARVGEDRDATVDHLAARDGREVGEIAMRSVKSGYAYVNMAPEESRRRFRDGWLYSGDLGTWDADGYVTVVGRRDDMIISGGENVHPVQVEEVLNEHPEVMDSVVVGVPDPTWGELVVAYVQPVDPDQPPDVAALDAHCRAHPMLADFKRPRRYRIVERLPRTATGKKMHYRLRAEARATGALDDFVRP